MKDFLSDVGEEKMPFTDVRVIFGKSATIIRQNFQIIVNFQISRFIAELKQRKSRNIIRRAEPEKEIKPKWVKGFVLNRERFNTNTAKRNQFVLNRERFNTN